VSAVVLVADDNHEFLRVVRRLLTERTAPVDVRTVETGERALAFLKRRPPFETAPTPSIVVLDFRLPDMRATSILRQMRASTELMHLPVLVLSQAGWAEDAAAAREAGATDFRVKPSRVQDLLRVIEEFWADHGNRDDPADRG
jgi:two-component system response regulator